MSDLQTAFYIIGIIYMTLSTLFLLAIIVFLWQLKIRIDRFEKNVKDRVEKFVNSISLMIPSFILRKIMDWLGVS